MNTIKHNVMLTYATTDIILNLMLRQETTRAWNALDEELATIGRIQREFLPKHYQGLTGLSARYIMPQAPAPGATTTTSSLLPLTAPVSLSPTSQDTALPRL